MAIHATPDGAEPFDIDTFAGFNGLTREQAEELVRQYGQDPLKLQMAADGLKLADKADNHPAPGQDWNSGAPRLGS